MIISAPTHDGNFTIAGQETYAEGIAFSPDGTRMFVVGDSTDNVTQYTLSTAWGRHRNRHLPTDVQRQRAGHSASRITFSNDGLTMFIAGDIDNAIDYYTLTTAFDITAGVFPCWRV